MRVAIAMRGATSGSGATRWVHERLGLRLAELPVRKPVRAEVRMREVSREPQCGARSVRVTV